MTHRHRFETVVTYTQECSCGAEGQKCEWCRRMFDIAEMRTDEDGIWLCKPCLAELVAYEQERNRRRP